MLPFRFPFRWGVPGAAAAPAVPSVETWGRITASAGGWQLSAAPVLPRFEHTFPLDDTNPWTKETV